jgi:L-lactate dehydrogenase complex protein LldE
MKLALFIPCYIDAFFPEVGIATLELLERLGCSVEYPLDQTCCGQPMANSGCQDDAAPAEAQLVRCFQGFDTVVGPSGSCVHHVRFHLDAIEQTPQTQKVRGSTRELVEFLHDDLKVEAFPWASFPHKVGLHNSCTAVRGLGHARPSERVNDLYFSKTGDLLGKVQGLELVEIDRPDECCGFGGSFCVTDEAVSAKMGYDKVQDFYRHGVEYIASADMSCLLHMKGVIDRLNLPLKVIHIAQILNGGPL